jgi:hypothetical protein
VLLLNASCGVAEPLVREGQRYRALRDLEVAALTHWRAPFTGGFEVTLPAGEIFIIANDPPASATAVYCTPERYEELHSVFIPEEDRNAETYAGYSLVIDLGVIRQHTELLPR